MFEQDDHAFGFLIEGDALRALAASEAREAPAEYVTSYIGSKRKLVDWIWQHTPEGVNSVLDAFCGSAVVAYMYKKQGLRVVANDRLPQLSHFVKSLSMLLLFLIYKTQYVTINCAKYVLS